MDQYGNYPPQSTVSYSSHNWNDLVQSVNRKHQAFAHRRGFRARKACDNCRSQKAKCDEERPCGNCKERKLDCKYKETPLRKDEKDLLMNLFSLEARMESKLDEFRGEMCKWRQEMDEKVDRVLQQIGGQVERPIQSTTSQDAPLWSSVQADSHMSDVDTGTATDGHATAAEGLPACPISPGSTPNQNIQASQSRSSPDIQALTAGSNPTIQGSSTGSNGHVSTFQADSSADMDGISCFDQGVQATPPRFYEDFLRTLEEEAELESMITQSIRNQ